MAQLLCIAVQLGFEGCHGWRTRRDTARTLLARLTLAHLYSWASFILHSSLGTNNGSLLPVSQAILIFVMTHR